MTAGRWASTPPFMTDHTVLPAPFLYAPPVAPLDYLHIDADILVVAKPSGLLSVPGKHPDHRDCLEYRVQRAYPDARIVHRLDMDTSGVMVMAMNRAAHRHLGLQFERRKIAKVYQARVAGVMCADEGRVDLPLICDWPQRPKQKVCFVHGKTAQTDWEVMVREGRATRVRLFPLTGRSHQLRVHMLSLGHVILGDRFYAEGPALEAADRLQLHAEALTLHHPNGGARMIFQTDCPF